MHAAHALGDVVRLQRTRHRHGHGTQLQPNRNRRGLPRRRTHGRQRGGNSRLLRTHHDIVRDRRGGDGVSVSRSAGISAELFGVGEVGEGGEGTTLSRIRQETIPNQRIHHPPRRLRLQHLHHQHRRDLHRRSHGTRRNHRSTRRRPRRGRIRIRHPPRRNSHRRIRRRNETLQTRHLGLSPRHHVLRRSPRFDGSHARERTGIVGIGAVGVGNCVRTDTTHQCRIGGGRHVSER
mmetsp:Transcript_9233/g.19405  ORF Transcript_9233/g.19405 Transcript_9233/m.19405 type:complete len:235 (+) Transcript_9233:227-931(+)